ncbi:M20/M25/M40 family metallo-hydrolase [Bradyrhizobium sp. 190]|uniref:M20/M25/M40 family metallo-hydrolase n=1 Tax=Bradyrhizobium sp. 190 TaxID=2782658 RepID=UPI0027E18657|nr:M20/M25/M40 family metallo-hydrolase [Bradyrhizobium sp. 190]
MRRAPKWPAPIPPLPKSHNHCAELLVAPVATEAKLSINNISRTLGDRLDLSEDLLQLTEGIARRLGYASLRLPGLAAHDAMNMHLVCPTALIFVPCRGGISHSELEWCEPDHATAGARVLLSAAFARRYFLTIPHITHHSRNRDTCPFSIASPTSTVISGRSGATSTRIPSLALTNIALRASSPSACGYSAATRS